MFRVIFAFISVTTVFTEIFRTTKGERAMCPWHPIWNGWGIFDTLLSRKGSIHFDHSLLPQTPTAYFSSGVRKMFFSKGNILWKICFGVFFIFPTP